MKLLLLTVLSTLLLCPYITNVDAVTASLSLQQPSDVARETTVSYTCVSSGNGADPTLRWFLRDRTNSGVNLQELTNQAVIGSNTNTNDGEISSTLSIYITSTFEDKRLWCSAYDNPSSSTVDVYVDIIVNKATLYQSCVTLNCITGTTCISSTCVCSSGFYDSNGAADGGTCVQQATLGESCTFGSTNQCGTANSVCSSSSLTCVCQSGYSESSNACIIQAGVGDFCSNTVSCQTANSICVGNTCTCNSGYYDSNGGSNGGSCFQQVSYGGSCNPSIANICGGTNTVCSTITNTCSCASGYSLVSGSCQLTVGLGSSCSSTAQCSSATSQSSCINGVCQCNTNYYDSDGEILGGACLAQVSYGGSCNPSIPNNCGGSNAACSSSTFRCECASGYSYVSGSCQFSVGLGSSCTSTTQCTTATSQSSCFNNICQCNTNYYDSDGATLGGTCLSQVSFGGSCNPSIPNNCGGSNVACSSSTFRCVCASGYSYVSGSCQFSVGLGSSCSSTTQCTSATSQSSCINNICQCNTNYYDSDGASLGGTCLSQVSYGGICNPSIPNNCGGFNVACSSTSNTCVCASGYAYVSGTCQSAVSLGSACSTTSQCTSATTQSSCVNGVCQCNTNYYASEGNCLFKISLGSNCPFTSACADANAICSGTCQCNSGYSNQGGTCISTSSSACPTSTQSESTTQGSTSPIAPDVTVSATCYLVSLYDTQIMPCRDSKRSLALRSGAWYKRNNNGQLVQVVTSTGSFINGDITNPNLTISNAQASYAGNYVCRLCYASNFAQCTDSADVEVRIDGSDLQTASVTVNNASPTRGTSITFTCNTVPTDAATSFVWRRNSVTLGATGSTLTIGSVGTADSGSYSCTASNQFSSATSTSTSSVSLDVRYAPEYSLQGGTDTVTYLADLSTGDTTVVCAVSANPAVSSYSFFDASGTNLYTGSSNQMTVTSNMGYQRYYCTATNTVGTSPVLYLEVQESSAPNTGAATEDDGGISTGVIAAIVIGIIFLLLLIIIIIVCCCNYGWCRKNEKKVEPEIIVQPPVKPYIPRAVLSDQGSEVSRKDVGIMMNGHHNVSTDFEEPTLTPRYYLKPATESGPIISMFEDNYATPRAHQLPALDTQYLYRDEEPKKKRRRRKKKRHQEPEPEPRYAEVQPPEDDDLVVIPGRNSNYYE